MIFTILPAAFLLIMVLAVLLEKGKRISRLTSIIIICFSLIATSISYAFRPDWFLAGFYAILGISLAVAEYKNRKMRRKLEKQKKELQQKLEQFEQDLQEYRSKRDEVKVRGLFPAEQNTR